MQSYYSAKLGIMAQQQRIDTIANNIANISTDAYKSVRTDFKDALYTEMKNPAEPDGDSNLQRGSGVMMGAAMRSFAQGIPQNTGDALDLYIDGDGFFTISGNDGLPCYTRNGCFAVSNETDGRYLVTAQGDYVLDTAQQKIKLPGNAGDIAVGEHGELSVGDTPVARLNIVTFINKNGLYLAGGGAYSASDASGEGVPSQASIRQGFREASNVDMSLELTRLMRAQRAFSMASRALVISDGMDAAANSMRA